MGLFRTRRGIGLLAFATVMALACVLLGLWQLDRYQQRGERNEAIRSALDAQPVPLDELVPGEAATGDGEGATSADLSGIEWRPVVVRGVFDPNAELTLRLRPVQGQSGVHALGVLVLDDGRGVLVDRGFLATASRSTASVDLPAAASGPVELVGRVRLAEDGRGAGLDTDSTPASIRFVDLDDLQSFSSVDLAPVWVERIEQSPREDVSLSAVPAPGLSSGPSLIYAVQWFLFGVIAVVGFVLLARRDSAESSASDEADAAMQAPDQLA